MSLRAKPFQPLLDLIPAPFRNRYFLLLLVFFTWMIFFDKGDMLTQWRLSQSVEDLKQDQLYYQAEIDKLRAEKAELEINKERFAREKYFMKKQDEDVFIIVDKNAEKK